MAIILIAGVSDIMKKFVFFKEWLSHVNIPRYSDLFYGVHVDGNVRTILWGKVGSQGRSQTKEFKSSEKALMDAVKKIDAKVLEGYFEAEGDSQGYVVAPLLSFRSSAAKFSDKLKYLARLGIWVSLNNTPLEPQLAWYHSAFELKSIRGQKEFITKLREIVQSTPSLRAWLDTWRDDKFRGIPTNEYITGIEQAVLPDFMGKKSKWSLLASDDISLGLISKRQLGRGYNLYLNIKILEESVKSGSAPCAREFEEIFEENEFFYELDDLLDEGELVASDELFRLNNYLTSKAAVLRDQINCWLGEEYQFSLWDLTTSLNALGGMEGQMVYHIVLAKHKKTGHSEILFYRDCDNLC